MGRKEVGALLKRSSLVRGVNYSGTDIDWIFNFGVKWEPPQDLFAGFDARYNTGKCEGDRRS